MQRLHRHSFLSFSLPHGFIGNDCSLVPIFYVPGFLLRITSLSVLRACAAVLLAVLFGAFSAEGVAASFDCKSASVSVERYICSDPSLSALDDRLAAAYQQALVSATDREAVKHQQREWLTRVRAVCLDRACLKASYDLRLAQLAATRDKENAKPSAPAKRYPPYPEVWGYELPWPGRGDRDSQVHLFRIETGEIDVAHVSKRELSKRVDGTCCNIQAESVVLSFFAGHTRSFAGKDPEYSRFWQENHTREIGKGLPVLSKITFSDGSTVRLAGKGGGGSCYSPFDHYVEAKDRDGKVIAQKSLVYLLKEPRVVPYSSRCADAEGEVTERAQSEDLRLVELADDTFLIVENRGNVILRLDKTLTTRFPLNERVFLVDWEVIEQLRQQARRESRGEVRQADQALNDAVFHYITKLRGGKP